MPAGASSVSAAPQAASLSEAPADSPTRGEKQEEALGGCEEQPLLLPLRGAAAAEVPSEAPAEEPRQEEAREEREEVGLQAVETEQAAEPEGVAADLEGVAAERQVLLVAGEAVEEAVARPEVPSAPPVAVGEPLFVRGRSGPLQEDGALAALVADVLPGWKAVDRSTISVEEVSGEGAKTTHRVSAEGAQPPSVALHCWSEVGSADAIYVHRTSAAGRLFAEAGLAPPRLAQGGDWYIEPWEGEGTPELGPGRMTELGELVARIHRLPTAWFDPWREQLCERLPALRKVPPGSHVWWWSSREELLGKLTEECRQAWLSARWLSPASAAGSRIVTAHADLHDGNMLQTPAGIRVIDFEYTCVTHAIQDICFAAAKCCNGEASQKRAFAEAYLRASGFAAGGVPTEEEVEALLFDAEVAFLGCHTGPLELWIGHDDPQKWLQRFFLFRAFVEEARVEPALRRRVLELGIAGYLKEVRDFCLPQSPVVLCDVPPCPNSRLVVNADGTISPEARRRGLVLGVQDNGLVVLVPREDKARRLVFKLQQNAPHPAPAEGGATPREADAAGAGDLALLLDSHPGKAVIARFWERRVVRGGVVVEPLALGYADQAAVVSVQGPHIVRVQRPLVPGGAVPGGAGWLAMFVGDPVQELGRRSAEELYDAASRGDAAALLALLDKGADVNWRQEHESLGHAAVRGGHLAALQVLLARGWDADTPASYGGSALIEAAQFGHVECVKRLLQVDGLNLGLKEEDKTALDWARDPSPHAEHTPGHAEISALIEATAKARVCPLLCGMGS